MATIVTRASKGSALTWTEGDANVTNLNNDKIELTDLSVTQNAAGTAALSYNNTTGVFSYTPPDLSSYLTGITGENITSLSDVYASMAPTDGQVLTWDNANSYWTAATPSGGGASALDDLSDVDVSTASSGDFLVYGPTGWYNSAQTIPSQTTDLSDWPSSAGGTSASGDVTSVDGSTEELTLNVLTGAINDISINDQISFMGTDVSSAGLTISTQYFVTYVDEGNSKIQISSTEGGATYDLTSLPSPSNFTFTHTPAGGGGGPTSGDVLTWTTGGILTWSSAGGGNLSDLSDVSIMTPSTGQALVYGPTGWYNSTISLNQLSSDLDTSGYKLSSTDAGTNNTVRIDNINYNETPYSLGSTDSPSIDCANGTVQTVTITSGLALPAFTNAITGQSVTLIVTGSGTATGTANHKFAGGATTLTSYSVVSVFYDGTTYWCSIATDFQ